MIPIEHGEPNLLLTPGVRLYSSTSGKSFVGFPVDGQRIVLQQDHEKEEVWNLFLTTDQGEGLLPFTSLLVYRDCVTLETFLQGRWGLCSILVKKNPPGMSPLSLYFAIKVPVPWIISDSNFIPELEEAET